MLSEPTTVEPAPGQPAPRTSGRSVDAELVLAAVDRMEAAIGRGRGTLDRLHAELAAMAQTIAQAKIAMQPGAVKPGAADGGALLDVAALLDELEHRVDAMLEIGGHVRPKEPPQARGLALAELLRPGPQVDGIPEAGYPVAAQSASAPMLEAMVLALSALDVVNQQAAEPRPAEEASRPAEEAAQEAAQEATPEVAPARQEPARAVAGRTPAPAAASILPENELLTSFTRMEAFPIPPPETGTAVIFEPRQPGPAANSAPLEAVAPLFADTPKPAVKTAIEATADSDPDDLLFEPQLDADLDLAAFLLEPLPAQSGAARVPPGAAPASPTPASPAKPGRSDGAASSTARPDPLAPLNAMSAAEKIALFS